MKWFVRVITEKGRYYLPLDDKGCKTKQEATKIATQAEKVLPETTKIEVVKI